MQIIPRGLKTLEQKFNIGDSTYLKVPVKGYRYVEIIGFDGLYIIVRTTSGWEFAVQEHELEEI